MAPAYFVERHGQIIIIALGEAIVQIGAGAEDSVGRPGVAAVLLAVLIAAGLWWSHFGYGDAGRTHTGLPAPDKLGTMAAPRDRAGRQLLTRQRPQPFPPSERHGVDPRPICDRIGMVTTFSLNLVLCA